MQEFNDLLLTYKNKIEKTINLISEEELKVYENKMEVKFGYQLSYYILHFGYLALNHIELLGINNKQNFDSDMVKFTNNLHSLFAETKNLIAIYKATDDICSFVDKEDFVYQFDIVSQKMESLNTNMICFIKNLFLNA